MREISRDLSALASEIDDSSRADVQRLAHACVDLVLMDESKEARRAG